MPTKTHLLLVTSLFLGCAPGGVDDIDPPDPPRPLEQPGLVAFAPGQVAVGDTVQLIGVNFVAPEHGTLAVHLTGPVEQKRAALTASLNPTIPALYRDPEILKANPFFGDLLDTFTNAVARPSRVTGSRYNQVSSEFRNAVHETLSGRTPPDPSLARLQGTLERLSRGGKW